MKHISFKSTNNISCLPFKATNNWHSCNHCFPHYLKFFLQFHLSTSEDDDTEDVEEEEVADKDDEDE